MNIDSRICEYIIADFVRTDSPILTVHDSFIVRCGEEERLEVLMDDAFSHVTSMYGIKTKSNGNITKKQIYAHDEIDIWLRQSMMNHVL